ncbi:hypothetical protein TruAng_011539 [Truncatella angustata]|nr:hypothetical protein TruAng_011539 [Truncatella angustata]
MSRLPPVLSIQQSGSMRWLGYSLAIIFVVFLVSNTHYHTIGVPDIEISPGIWSQGESGSKEHVEYSESVPLEQTASAQSHALDSAAEKPKLDGPPIPRKIWQIFFPLHGPPDERLTNYIGKWLRKATGYSYELIGADGGASIVERHYGLSSEVYSVYQQLKNPGLKADLLRYLVLFAEGGYYGDTDTYPFPDIDEWVPAVMRSRVNVVVGLEHDDAISMDRRQDYGFSQQLGNNAFAMAPGHPVGQLAVDRSLVGLYDVARRQGTTLGEIKSQAANDILNSTGPWAFTEAVQTYLQDIITEEGSRTTWSMANLSIITGPTLVADVLVWPITAFRHPAYTGEQDFDTRYNQTRLLEHEGWGGWRTG